MTASIRAIPLALALLQAADPGAVLVREYKKEKLQLMDLSPDGRLMLAQTERRVDCPAGPKKCRVRVLSVRETATGEKLGHEFVSVVDGYFHGVRFRDGAKVDVAYLSRLHEWDWQTDSRSSRPISDGRFSATCFVGDEEVLGWQEGSLALLQGGSVRLLAKRVDFVALMENCSSWKGKAGYFIPSGHAVLSVSLRPDEFMRVCHDFPGERLYGVTVSPDGSLVAAVTNGGPQDGVTLTLLSANDCHVIRRLDLAFPERPTWVKPLLNPKAKYRNNVPFQDQFARRMAVSPNNHLIAISYGIFKDPHGYAYFGLYSLSDGSRKTTLPGDAYKCGILHGALLSDAFECRTSPIQGALRFSPDSRMLFATSLHLRQWDVSQLQ